MTASISNEAVEAVEVAIAEELHLIPNGTAWEDKSARLAEKAITALLESGEVVMRGEVDGLVDAISKLTPFTLVQGDTIHRTNPCAKQVVNSNEAWLVSEGNRSAHKLRLVAQQLEEALSRLHKKEK